jgi:hypothetical protein
LADLGHGEQVTVVGVRRDGSGGQIHTRE